MKTNPRPTPKLGVAQLVERCPRKAEAVGSSPTTLTNLDPIAAAVDFVGAWLREQGHNIPPRHVTASASY